MVLDTNTLIRYFTQDDVSRAKRVADVLKSGTRPFLTDVTFAEVYWVLRSFYKFSDEKIIEGFTNLVNTNSIRCNNKIISRTLNYLSSTPSLRFIDAYTAAYAKEYEDGIVLSFDSDFDKISSIKRNEP